MADTWNISDRLHGLLEASIRGGEALTASEKLLKREETKSFHSIVTGNDNTRNKAAEEISLPQLDAHL